MYQIIEILPADADATALDVFRQDFFIPNLEAATELAQELGGLIAGNLERFIVGLFTRVADLVLQEIAGLISDIERQVLGWLTAMQGLAAEIAAALTELAEEIGALTAEVMEKWDAAFTSLEQLLRLFSRNWVRQDLRREVARRFLQDATRELERNDFYAGLPGPAKRIVRDALEDAAGAVLDNDLFDPVWEALASLSAEAAELMEDIRNLDPTEDQIADLFLDRIEDLVRAVFGGSTPAIPLTFSVNIEIAGPFGRLRLGEEVRLGRIELPLSQIIQLIRDFVRGLSAFEQAVRRLANTVIAAIESEIALHGAEAERDAAAREQEIVRRQLDDSARLQFAIDILSPTPTGFYQSDIEVEIFLDGVPFSFLGLGALEQQRVHIWLNQTLLELSTFTVEEQNGQPPASKPDLMLAGTLKPGITIDGRGTPSRPNIGASGRLAPVLLFQPGAPVGDWGETFLVDLQPPATPIQHRASIRNLHQRRTVPSSHPAARAVASRHVPASQFAPGTKFQNAREREIAAARVILERGTATAGSKSGPAVETPSSPRRAAHTGAPAHRPAAAG